MFSFNPLFFNQGNLAGWAMDPFDGAEALL